LNSARERRSTVSIDELSAEQKQRAKQYVLWTAVVVIGGYVVLFLV